MKRALSLTIPLLLLVGSVAAAQPAQVGAHADPRVSTSWAAASGAELPADRILRSVDDEVLRALLTEVLRRNPDVAQARARARAAEQVAPQVRALPDPTARLTAYLLEPETRVGPQELSFSFAQAFPWFGTLPLRERAALEAASATGARSEAVRLQILTEARRWYHELSYLGAEERVLREERRTLTHFEDLARARYEAGRGLQQGPVKIQAEITRIDLKLLDIQGRRDAVLAALNSLRNRAGTTPQGVAPLPEALARVLELGALRRTAWALRPEVAAADADISAAGTGIELSRKRGKPSFTLGAGYTLVGGREDAAGRANPPADDGDDVFALTAGASLPVWRGKVRAGIEQASELQQVASQGKLALLARIEREITDLGSRLRVSWDRIRLHDDLLVIQAEQSLSSGLSAYSAGAIGALELLDSERILFAVRLSAERAKADHAIALARLEGAVAAPVSDLAPAFIETSPFPPLDGAEEPPSPASSSRPETVP